MEPTTHRLRVVCRAAPRRGGLGTLEGMPTLPPELDHYPEFDDDDDRPVGLLGRLRQAKVLTWLTIVGMVALSIGALSYLIVVLR